MCQHRGKPARGRQPVGSGTIRCFESIREQLAAYFRAELREFELPLRMAGTPFQRPGLGGTASDSLRRDRELRRACPADRAAGGIARGRVRERAEPHRHRCSLPSRHRRRWNPGGYGGGLDRKEWLLEHRRDRRASGRPRRAQRSTTLRPVSRSTKLSSMGLMPVHFRTTLWPSARPVRDMEQRRPGSERAQRS